MASEELPDWLPDGWFAGVRTKRGGEVEKVYTSPVSGHTFNSKTAVLRYLNFEKPDGHRPQSTVSCQNDHLEYDSPEAIVQGESPLWLPRGWILEIKTRRTGKTAGRKYKCYIDPSTGARFYSKQEVFRFLESGDLSKRRSIMPKANGCQQISMETRNEASKHNKNDLPGSPDDVLAQIESSPDGLPPGWIKELKYRRNNTGLRKDPYYIDPVSGYVFRSKKDVFRYLETGEISRHAFKPKSYRHNFSIDDPESPPPITARSLKQAEAAARRRLFLPHTPSSSNKSAGLCDEETSFQNTDPGTPQRVEGPVPSLATSSEANNVKENTTLIEGPSKIHVNQDCEPDVIPEGLKRHPQQISGEVAEKFSGSESNGIPNQLETNILQKGMLVNLESMDKANSLVNVSTRRHVKKLAVRKSYKKNIGGNMSPEQPVSMNSDDLSSQKLSIGNPSVLISENEKPSALKDVLNSEVDDKNEPNMSEIPAKQVNEKTQDIPQEHLSEEADGKHSRTANKKQKSRSKASDKLKKKPKMTSESMNDTGTKCATRSSRIVSTNARGTKHVTRSSHIVSTDVTGTKQVTRSSRIVSTNATETLSKDGKSVSSPCRASKRLAGMEPSIPSNIDVSYRSLRKMRKVHQTSTTPNHMDEMELKTHSNHEQATETCRKTKGKEPISVLPSEHEEKHTESAPTNKNSYSSGEPLQELASDSCSKREGKKPISLGTGPDNGYIEALQTDGKRKQPLVTSPFGDAWPDPCIEFAFKTLTGDIPVFDNSTIEDYFQQQMSPTVNPTTTSLDTPTHARSMSDLNATSVKSQQDHPINDGIRTGGEKNKASGKV